MTRGLRGLSVLTLAVAAAVLAPSPASAAATVALWHLDDTGTVMADSSGNGLNGKSVGVTLGQPGVAGTAYGFAKKPAYATVASSTKLNPGTAAFTVSARVKFATKPSAAVGDYDLVRKGLAGVQGGHWKMEIVASGKAYCLFHGAAGRVAFSNGPVLADNAWHAVSCTRSGTVVTLTVDGKTYSKTGATGSIANTSLLRVGNKNNSGGDQYTGLMDEVSIAAG